MAISSKAPPRFVPTLTEVVAEHADAAAPAPAPLVLPPLPDGFDAVPEEEVFSLPEIPPLLLPELVPSSAPVLPAVEAEPLPYVAPVVVAPVPVPASAPLGPWPSVHPGDPTMEMPPWPLAAAAKPETAPAPEPLPPEPMPTATTPSEVATCADPQALQDQWVELFLQRIDGALDTHLHQTIATIVQEQTRIAFLRLREEIELGVRQAVRQAILQEYAGGSDATDASVASPD